MQQMGIEERSIVSAASRRGRWWWPWNGFELADLLNMAGVQVRCEIRVRLKPRLRPDECRVSRISARLDPMSKGLRLG